MPGFVVRPSSLGVIALRKATMHFLPILILSGQHIHCRSDHPDHDIHTRRTRARRGTAGADCGADDNGDGGRRSKSDNWALHWYELSAATKSRVHTRRLMQWCVLADQCTDEPYTIKYTKSGEKVIVDREATVEYIFNIYYWYV